MIVLFLDWISRIHVKKTLKSHVDNFIHLLIHFYIDLPPNNFNIFKEIVLLTMQLNRSLFYCLVVFMFVSECLNPFLVFLLP